MGATAVLSVLPSGIIPVRDVLPMMAATLPYKGESDVVLRPPSVTQMSIVSCSAHILVTGDTVSGCIPVTLVLIGQWMSQATLYFPPQGFLVSSPNVLIIHICLLLITCYLCI